MGQSKNSADKMQATALTAHGVCENYVEDNRLLSFEKALLMERGMLDAVCEATARGQRYLHVSLWQSEQAIILPSGMSRREGIAAASQFSGRSGWPVYERDTGGDVTPQFGGVVNISMGFALYGEQRNIAAAYGRLTDPLIAFLKSEHGIDAYLASVKGAFCDGSHNLVVAGKKLAGTAQRWRLVKQGADQMPATGVLGHIVLLCGGELSGALSATNSFFEAAGIDRRIDPAVHVTLADLVREGSEPADVSRRLIAFMDNGSWQ